MTYAEIVFPIPVDKRFHYRIPEPLQGQLKVGARVTVNFAYRSETGYCVGLADSLPPEAASFQIKDIAAIIDPEPLLNDRMLKLCQWISEYYFCSLGQAIEAALPAGVRKIPKGKPRASKTVDPFLSGEVPLIEPHTPNEFQAKALATILPALDHPSPILSPEGRGKGEGIFLLHGITGSGKTEVYLQAINKTLGSGKQAIVLVPEIALTPQTIHRFRQRFSTDKIAVLHSHLTEKERAEHWKRIRSGQAQIVIGARSAIFAPAANLGLIVIDEEHEPTYKQQNTPLYHARDVAVKRAQLENACVILGSATPSLESYHLASLGEYKLLNLPERIEQRPLPPVDVVDMSKEVNPKNPMPILSKLLEVRLKQAVDAGNQVILFLNRRGFVTMVTCPRCRFVLRCKRCEVALTYHKQTAKGHSDKLFCHYCGREQEMPANCPDCGHNRLRNTGTGTEKVEEHIKKIFDRHRATEEIDSLRSQRLCGEMETPKVARMDSDIMRTRQTYHQALQELATGETDIMVGTQMIAKGLDLPNVTLVGIISGDTALYIKDFRSAERAFQLITQVAGRSGRGPKGGRVVVQTFNPEHYSIQTAAKHDYEAFARKELLYRYELNYPPFSHLVRILVEGSNSDKVATLTQEIASIISKQLVTAGQSAINNQQSAMEILGPAPAPLGRIRGRFRWHIILKSREFSALKQAVDAVRPILPQRGRGLSVSLDHDPISLL
jgi:primosomal protein N' (replication factor Y)